MLNSLAVDFATGHSLPTPTSLAEFAAAARRAPVVGINGFQRFALPYGMNTASLAKAGWAVVVPEKSAAARRDLLRPLLDLRRSEAAGYHHELLWTAADQSARTWLKRHYAGFTVDPGKVPYYLLLVGSPEEIPFEVQFELNAAGYATGRLDFGNESDSLRRYAEAVCDQEHRLWPRRVGFWATRQDESTRTSHDLFALPLARGLPDATEEWQRPVAEQFSFNVEEILGTDARKSALLAMLRDTPVLSVLASHGVAVRATDGDPLELQGALISQEWWGRGKPGSDSLVTASDLDQVANVSGTFALIMACFGGGTPAHDNFPWAPKDATQAGPYYHGRPFTAALPRRMLSHENGPAMAVMAHIDRTWGWSFAPSAPGERSGPFRTFLARLMNGERVGHAASDLSVRLGSLGVQLAGLFGQDQAGISDQELSNAWVEFRDSRNYILFGDPATRPRLEAAPRT